MSWKFKLTEINGHEHVVFFKADDRRKAEKLGFAKTIKWATSGILDWELILLFKG